MMTLVGGTTGSIALTVLQLKYRTADDTPDILALNILLGIGASFAAAGFISWDILQIKEVIMAIADWIREHTTRSRERFRAEVAQEVERNLRATVRQEVQETMREEVRETVLREVQETVLPETYRRGYNDARQGKPEQPPTYEPPDSGATT